MHHIYFPHDHDAVGFHTDEPLTLAQLQKIVGGYVELLSEHDYEFDVWMWEEARVFNTPVNAPATELLRTTYGYNMVGDMLITAENDDGANVGIRPDQEQFFNRFVLAVLGQTWLDYDKTFNEVISDRTERRAKPRGTP